MLSVRVFFVTSVSTIISACLFPSLGDLSGDASFDASFEDVSDAASDVSSDVKADAMVDAGRWCATHTPDGAVCFDYDGPDAQTDAQTDAQALASDISCKENDGGCTATITYVADDDSPPNAMVATIPALQPYPASAEARLRYAWPKGLSSATMAFDMRINNASPSGILAVFTWATIECTMNLGGNTFSFRAQDYVADSGVGSQTYNPLSAAIDFTKWHRFSFTVNASAKTVSVSVDGTNVITDTTRSIPYSGNISFEWGVNYVNGTTPETEYHFDNVVMSTMP